MNSYDITDVRDLPKSHLEFYKNTRMFYDTPDYFFVHAGIPPDKSVEKNILENPENGFYLWGREHLNARTVPWEKTVVFGHTRGPFPIAKTRWMELIKGVAMTWLGTRNWKHVSYLEIILYHKKHLIPKPK